MLRLLWLLQEAHRVLKPGGWLWICEVRSRFTGQSDGGGSNTQPGSPPAGSHDGSGGGSSTKGGEWVKLAFTRALQKLGFKLAGSKVMNKMFVVFELRKGKAPAPPAAEVKWPALKASVYKKQ
jgi:ribosomal RNA-processing protein 8